MKKTLLVMKTEIVNTVMRPSFIILTFGLPLVGFLVMTVFTNMSDSGIESFESFIGPSFVEEAQGYVDLGDTIKVIPSDVPEGALLAYPDEEAARQALESGEISSYYILPADVIESGELVVVQPDFSPLSGADNQWIMEWTLMVNLAGGDEELAAFIQYPMMVDYVSREPDAEPKDDSGLAYAVPYAVTLCFYMIIFGSASTMLNSIGKEKQNRVIEVLLLSTSPIQLMTGKIIGLGLVGLLQTAIYTGVGFTLLRMSGRVFEITRGFAFPTELILWGLLFFLLGYSLYASLMAGAGALAPNTREASQITFILIIPMIIPLFFVSALITEPNSTLSVILSLFPFSAPVAMMTRLAATTVPLWQPLLAVALIGSTAYIVIILVSRLFRAQTLLSGQEFKPAIFFKALFGRT